jgi:hypothetical protein
VLCSSPNRFNRNYRTKEEKIILYINGVIATGENLDRVNIRIDYIANLIGSLTSSQRQLTVSALDLQSLAFAKKRQIKDSLNRAVELGEIQQRYIKILMGLTDHFVEIIEEGDDHKNYNIQEDNDVDNDEDNDSDNDVEASNIIND